MPLRNSEKALEQRVAHQSVDSYEVHGNLTDIAICYTNLLEERIYVLDLELSAMRDRFGHQLDPDVPKVHAVAMSAEETVQDWLVGKVEDRPTPVGGDWDRAQKLVAEDIAAQAARPPAGSYGDVTRQLADIRVKNTELEARNRDLREYIQKHQGWEGEKQGLQHLIASLSASERDLQKELERVKNERANVLENSQMRREELAECRKQIQSLNHDLEQRAKLLQGANEKVANLVKLSETSSPNNYATHTMHWCRDTFGDTIATDIVERAARLLEEATEVAQAANVPIQMAAAITHRVYNRPKGLLPQEMGGVIVCWSIMAAALGMQPSGIMDEALSDCWGRQDAIRAKLADKIKAGTSPSSIPTGSPFRNRTEK